MEKRRLRNRKIGLVAKIGLKSPHLLWRHVEGYRPEVDLPVGVDARDDEEDSGALGATLAQATEPENDRSLVLLNNLQKISPGYRFERMTTIIVEHTAKISVCGEFRFSLSIQTCHSLVLRIGKRRGEPKTLHH